MPGVLNVMPGKPSPFWGKELVWKDFEQVLYWTIYERYGMITTGVTNL